MSAAAAPARPDDAPPLAVWIGFFAMVLGNFMAILDVQIVASAIGAIQAGVSANRDEVSWVQTSYLIAEVIGIPLSGFLGRALGTRRLFCISAASFALTSLLCAFAWDINSLIVFRALQGFSGAAMIPTTMATLYIVMPLRYQPMGAAMIGVVSTLAPSLGPTLGGYIAEALGWRALFWLNLFPALVGVVLVWRLMRRLDPGDISLMKRIDIGGLIGLALFLGGAEYVLEEGPSNNWFESMELVEWTMLSLMGAVLFFYRAFRADTPIVDLRPFKQPVFAVSGFLAFVLGVGLYSSVFLLPLFLTEVRGYNSLQVGHTMFVQGAVMFLVGPAMGIIGRRIPDLRPVGAAGFLITGLSCWIQAHMTAEAGLAQLAWPQALRGLGLTLTFSAIMQPALSSLPPHLVHAGAGLFNTLRNIGGAFGIAFMATLQSHSFALHRQELYNALDPNNPHVQQMLAGMQAHLEQAGAADPERQALMQYASFLDREALVMAFNDQFLFLAFVLGLSALAVFLLKKNANAAAFKSDAAMAH